MFHHSYFSLSRQEQCTAMIELMKDYQSLKSSINTIVENAETVAVNKLGIKDQEDTRRSLSKVSIIHNVGLLEQLPTSEKTDSFFL